MPPAASVVRQVVVALLAVVALMLGVASPTWAHTALSSTTPEDGADLADAPSEVVLQFTDDVLDLGAAVAVTGPSGPVELAPPTVSGPMLTAAVPGGLGGGEYTVEWRATSSDGHPITGAFSFTVDGASQLGPTAPSGAPSPSPPPASAPAVQTPAAAGSGSAQPVAAEEAGASTAWLFAVPAVVAALAVAAVVVLRTKRQR